MEKSDHEWAVGQGFYSHVQAGYDSLAPTYDEDIGSNLIGLRMRRIFRAALLKAFHPAQHLFEIGCGTGIDALWLAEQGFHVTATDISDQMLRELSRKAVMLGLSERLECRKCSAGDIGTLEQEFGTGTFDGGYCHAGALNMEPALARVPGEIRSLIRPGGRFVCSVINKTSLFEVVFYSAILHPRKAYRRLDRSVPIPISRKAPLNRYVVSSRFYSPSEIRKLFQEGFSVETVQGVQVLLPPSNLTDLYAVLRPIFVPFDSLENRISTRWPFNTLGHHTILTFRRD